MQTTPHLLAHLGAMGGVYRPPPPTGKLSPDNFGWARMPDNFPSPLEISTPPLEIFPPGYNHPGGGVWGGQLIRLVGGKKERGEAKHAEFK